MMERVSTPNWVILLLSTKSLQITLEVEKQPITMEVDNGAAVSLMSE